MSVALYRKYRPKNFSDVTNQNHVKITLQNEIENDRLGHAYLFCGPRGTGKTTLARLLAKSVNCLDLQPNGEACNKCEICQEILDSKSMDIIEIDAASHTGVDNVRENVINNARFTPTRNKYKVFIIDEVHMLSISAFNALLKILEEPPKYVIFILATTEAHKVPATIISRCQRFDFKKIIVSELIERLRWIAQQEEIKIEDKVLSLIAKQAGGCVRDAESLMEQVFSLGEKNITLEQAELILPKADNDSYYELFELLVNKNKVDAIILINKLVSDGLDVVLFTDGFVEFLRKVLLYKVTEDLDDLARDFDENVMKKVMAILPKISEAQLIQIIEKCLTNQNVFKQNYLFQLPLEVTVLELCMGNQPAVRDVVKEVSVAQVVSPSVEIKVEKKEDLVTAVQEKKEENFSIENKNEEKQEISSPDLTRILNVWSQVLQQVKANHYSLYMSLHMGKPMSFSDNKLVIGFLFELQRSRVDDVRAKNIINEVFFAVLGQKFDIEPIVDPRLSLSDLPKNGNGHGGLDVSDIPHTPVTPPDEADDVANEFGGTVVG